MKIKELKFLITTFVVWRISLFVFLFLAIKFVPLQENFLGGGMGNYVSNPYLWSWANFDGEHYLSIAQRGYGFGEEPFFPLYPLLIRILGGGIWQGLLISHLAFFVALIGFYNLIRLDFSEKVAKFAVLLLLLFPTSFYFGSVFTESLFLAIVVWFFWFIRKKKWAISLFLAAIASGVRLVGALLLFPVGLFGYMYYLNTTRGDALAFIHNITIFGEQRSGSPILLPQVFYRYFVKILPNLNYLYFPTVFVTFLEVSVAILFLILTLIAFKKLKFSYALYAAGSYLIPTLSGSFSSLPRYVLIIFPAFIIVSLYLIKATKTIQVIIFLLLFLGLAISTILFVRGFWIS